METITTMPGGIAPPKTPEERRPLSQAANPAREVRDASNANDSESAPNSQDTHASNSSKTSGRSQLSSDSSSLSNASDDTSSTSPVSLKATLELPVATALQPPISHIERPITPETRNVLKDSASEGTSSVSTSPLSAGSQTLKQGSKRTASGAVKPPRADSTNVVDYQRHTVEGLDSGRARSSSRAAEISAQLKARLQYAMVKVQHGWETSTLDQLERRDFSQASTPLIPSTPVAVNSNRRRESVYSDTSERFFNSPNTQTSPQPFPRAFEYHQSSAGHGFQYYSTPASMSTNGPSLAPAAPIAPARPGRRSISSRVPPNLITNRMPHPTSGQPTTPTSNPARQGILRMPSQQAEKDALEAMMFMSSPNNSSNLKHVASAASSPLRTEFPPAAKRVVFEGHR
ncbi:hypothetical protein EG328_005986 [Venturia inaequalis]|uniref:Uncharacterized protein n=1 Tax=Venturia inaequalis TaxID=5025 RepID=A0A8H3YV02_VENIN|nr:hypothetical protein EG328_005986 [Venturia inaequalis]